jgi:glycosyltransferase involved in cell wall biosynthesis
MRLAVFTSKYPAEVATFFERDMRGLLDAGVTLEVFSIYPLDHRLWRYALDILSPAHLPRNRVHHRSLRRSVLDALPAVGRHPARCAADAAAILRSAARFGPIGLAKTAYVLPKAWAWAARHGGRFDHVLAYWGNYAGTCAYAFHRLLPRPVPFSLWLHAGTDLYRTPIFMREKLAYADNIITCCDFNRRFLLQQYPDLTPPLGPRIRVCHHGLDLGDFPFVPDDRPPATVVAAGRFIPQKGFDDLLRAVHFAWRRGVAVLLELVGDGDQRKALEALTAELGLGDRVRFHGWLPFAEARRVISRATILVHPSPGLGDGLPNVVREAMALGTPVIASNVAGIPDALSDDCGILVPPRDPAALAAAIEGMLANPAVRHRIATHARARVEARYELWRNGAALADLLRATRRGAGRPAAVWRPEHAAAERA